MSAPGPGATAGAVALAPDLAPDPAPAAVAAAEPWLTTGIVTNMADPLWLKGDFPAFASAAEVMGNTGGNTGNVAFVEATYKLIGGDRRHLGWDAPAEAIRDGFDAVVICCANQIGSHCDLAPFVPLLEAWNKPLVLIGLGAQASLAQEMPEVPEGTRAFLRLCQAHRSGTAPNISVRGEFSRRCLENLGIESVVTGCPSGLLSGDARLGAAIAARVEAFCHSGLKPKLAVAAGNPWDSGNLALEGRLLQLVDEYQGDYIVQHPENLLQVVMEPETAPLDEAGRVLLDHYAPFLGGAVAARQWLRRHGAVHVNTGSWMTYLHRCDGVLGLRFHGVALGVQAGIPGLVIAIDSRTQELSQEAGIPCIPAEQASQLDQDGLLAATLWSSEVARCFDGVRAAKTMAMARFLQSNRLRISGHLAAMVAAMG